MNETQMKPKKSKHRLFWGVLICLPLAFIAYFIFTFTSGTLSVASVKGVRVTLPSGDAYTFDDEASIELYVGAVLDARCASWTTSGRRSSPSTGATGQSNTGCTPN